MQTGSGFQNQKPIGHKAYPTSPTLVQQEIVGVSSIVDEIRTTERIMEEKNTGPEDECRSNIQALLNPARPDDDFPWDDFEELSVQPYVDATYKDKFLDISTASFIVELAEQTFVSEPRKSPL